MVGCRLAVPACLPAWLPGCLVVRKCRASLGGEARPFTHTLEGCAKYSGTHTSHSDHWQPSQRKDRRECFDARTHMNGLDEVGLPTARRGEKPLGWCVWWRLPADNTSALRVGLRTRNPSTHSCHAYMHASIHPPVQVSARTTFPTSDRQQADSTLRVDTDGCLAVCAAVVFLVGAG